MAFASAICRRTLVTWFRTSPPSGRVSLSRPGSGSAKSRTATGSTCGYTCSGATGSGTLAELRDFLAEYHERDPADWALSDFQHVEGPGLIGAVEAFWLFATGVAVNVLTGPEA